MFAIESAARLQFPEHKDTRVGIRIPACGSYMFNNAPVNVCVEVAPILDLSPSVRGGFNAGIGVRYWF